WMNNKGFVCHIVQRSGYTIAQADMLHDVYRSPRQYLGPADPIVLARMDYDSLTTLRSQHPGWRLLAADHGPFVAAFLYRCFIEPNQRSFAEAELASRLEDFLFHLRERLGEEAFPKPVRQYLNDWAGDERG